jgi:tetratricopeptide (TPR) repeat protein
MAEARCLFRQDRLGDAVDAFRGVISSTRPSKNYEAAVLARLLLGPALVQMQAFEEARRVFADLIAICEEASDQFYLGAAYTNRTWLWVALGDDDSANDDLRTVIRISREAALAYLERAATYNLAEGMLWRGAIDDALELATRSFHLQHRHGDGSTTLDDLLLARVHAARRSWSDVRCCLDRLAHVALTEPQQLVSEVLRDIDRGSPPDWGSLLGRDDVEIELRLELAALAAREQLLPEANRAEVRRLATHHPIWSRRLGEL